MKRYDLNCRSIQKALFALGMCRVRSSPACRTERQRSPEQPGPEGNA